MADHYFATAAIFCSTNSGMSSGDARWKSQPPKRSCKLPLLVARPLLWERRGLSQNMFWSSFIRKESHFSAVVDTERKRGGFRKRCISANLNPIAGCIGLPGNLGRTTRDGSVESIFAGVDVGGTRIKIGPADRSGRLLSCRMHATHDCGDSESFSQNCCRRNREPGECRAAASQRS